MTSRTPLGADCLYCGSGDSGTRNMVVQLGERLGLRDPDASAQPVYDSLEEWEQALTNRAHIHNR